MNYTRSNKLIRIIGIAMALIMGMALNAGAQVTIYSSATNNYGAPTTDFSPQFYFYLLIKVDQAKDITGAAMTIVYDNDVFEVAAENEFDGTLNLGYYYPTDGIFTHIVTHDGETVVPSMGNKDTTQQKNRNLHVAGAYPDPAKVTGGGGVYLGVQTLFRLKFRIKADAPAGTYPLTIMQRSIFNPAAGWYNDIDGSGFYQESVDPTTPVAVPPLTGAYSIGTAQWNSVGLNDDFFDIPATFAAPTNITVVSIVDTDGDGILDQWEIDNFGDLETADETTDYDQDGYSDKYEWINATDPKVPNDASDPNLDGYNIITDFRVSNLDVDGNGSADGGTDGVIILRYMSGYEGESLIAGLPLTGCTRCTGTEIQAHLDLIAPTVFDVDGDLLTNSGEDGKMILRYLSGYRGDEITAGIILDGCKRCTGAQIEAYLDLLDY